MIASPSSRLLTPAASSARSPLAAAAGVAFSDLPSAMVSGDSLDLALRGGRGFSPLSPGDFRMPAAERPDSNTGQKGQNEGPGIVDWCTLVFPREVFGEHVTDALIHGFLTEVFGDTGIAVGAIRDRFFNFYPSSSVLMGPDGTRAGDVGMGQGKPTVCVSLSGHGCRFVKDWAHVARVAAELGARLTRCDVAYDDVDGSVFDLPSLIELAQAGGFASGGRPPQTSHQDDHGSGRGCTLYVGGKGHKELCVYQKGKQLGDRQSPWVRAECRLYGKHVGGSVDLEALTDPLAYLKGSYDVMATLLWGACTRMTTVRAAVEASGNALVKWLKTQTGPSLNLLRCALGDEFEPFLSEHIFREDVPGRFRASGAHTDLVALLRVHLFDLDEDGSPPVLSTPSFAA